MKESVSNIVRLSTMAEDRETGVRGVKSAARAVDLLELLAGTTYLDTDPYLRIVQPHINELSTELDETIHFGRLERGYIVYGR